MNTLTYRKLIGYKYELLENINVYVVGLPDVNNEYIAIAGGKLFIAKGYAWDGPSGPAIDTKNFMYGSLVHDALYQLMREGLIDRKKWRDYADRLLQQHCIADGMNRFRAWYVYTAVKLFAKKSSMPRKNPRGEKITITTGSKK